MERKEDEGNNGELFGKVLIEAGDTAVEAASECDDILPSIGVSMPGR